MKKRLLCKTIFSLFFPFVVVSVEDKSLKDLNYNENNGTRKTLEGFDTLKQIIKKFINSHRCDTITSGFNPAPSVVPSLQPSEVPSSAPADMPSSEVPSSAPSDMPSEDSVKIFFPPDGQIGDSFGIRVGIFDDNVMVLSNSTTNAGIGAVYLFSSDGGLQEKISSVSLLPNDLYAKNAALSSSTVVLGAPHDDEGKGSGYILQLEDTLSITQFQAFDGEAGDEFSSNVAVSDSFIAVGAPSAFSTNETEVYSGAVYLFDSEGDLKAKLTRPDSYGFGLHVALTDDMVVIGGLCSFNIYSITFGTFVANFDADIFTLDVAVHGNTIVVGKISLDDEDVPGGSAFIYALDGTLVKELVAPDDGGEDLFGYSVAVSEDVIAVGAPKDNNSVGAVYKFTLDGEFIEKLVPPDQQTAKIYFGWDISLSESTLVVGAPAKEFSTGSVYVYSI